MQRLRRSWGLTERLVPDSCRLLHHDFRSANVLSAGTEIAAVIDFEEAVMLGTRFGTGGRCRPTSAPDSSPATSPYAG